MLEQVMVVGMSMMALGAGLVVLAVGALIFHLVFLELMDEIKKRRTLKRVVPDRFSVKIISLS